MDTYDPGRSTARSIPWVATPPGNQPRIAKATFPPGRSALASPCRGRTPPSRRREEAIDAFATRFDPLTLRDPAQDRFDGKLTDDLSLAQDLLQRMAGNGAGFT
jgi:hypothetical protein